MFYSYTISVFYILSHNKVTFSKISLFIFNKVAANERSAAADEALNVAGANQILLFVPHSNIGADGNLMVHLPTTI